MVKGYLIGVLVTRLINVIIVESVTITKVHLIIISTCAQQDKNTMLIEESQLELKHKKKMHKWFLIKSQNPLFMKSRS